MKDVRGPWKISQQGGTELHVDIFHQEKDGTFAGTIRHGNNTVTVEDTRVTDHEITFRAPWKPTSHGRYTGRFDFQGRITEPFSGSLAGALVTA